MRRRRPPLLVLAVLVAVVVAACGGGSDSAEKPKRTTTTSSSTTPTTTAPAVPVAPLTGLPDPGGQSLTRPLLSVKIENSPEARPQTGLDVADVVYEQVAEGGITRFLAMFNSAIPDVLGPVRSVRAMDPDVVWPLGGIFVFSGGAAPNVALIHQAPVNTIDENNAGDAFFRDRARRAPHNLFGRGPDLVVRGGQPVPVPALFQYHTPGQTVTGDPVSAFTVLFTKGFEPSYLWDAASKTWKRSYGFAPFTATSARGHRAVERDRAARGLLHRQHRRRAQHRRRHRDRADLHRRQGRPRDLVPARQGSGHAVPRRRGTAGEAAAGPHLGRVHAHTRVRRGRGHPAVGAQAPMVIQLAIDGTPWSFTIQSM